MKEVICGACGSKEIETKKQIRKTGGELVNGKRLRKDYTLNIHVCKKCFNLWEGDRVPL